MLKPLPRFLPTFLFLEFQHFDTINESLNCDQTSSVTPQNADDAVGLVRFTQADLLNDIILQDFTSLTDEQGCICQEVTHNLVEHWCLQTQQNLVIKQCQTKVTSHRTFSVLLLAKDQAYISSEFSF